MDDKDLLRYNRQILLPQVDIVGQQALANSSMAIVGLGGLGCPATMYLAAAGVGKLIIFDHDKIDLTNLQRQLAYTEQDIGQAKVKVMTRVCKNLNPLINVTALNQKFDANIDYSLIESCDVVIDATDNIVSRKSVNMACIRVGKPLVFAAAIRMEGQLTVFDSRLDHSPCYECVFGEIQVNESCSESGVLGTVVGVLGLMQATEAIKLVLGIGQSLVGRLQLYDASACEWQSIKISRNRNCSACGQR